MLTLDQLLDTLGKEPETEKVAAAPSDLVARLRKEAGDDQPADTMVAARAELAEKTAEIGVIAMTLAELEQAPGIKLAAPSAAPTARHRHMAVFIKSALERGHEPAEIAAFLRKEAGLGSAAEDIVGQLGTLKRLAKHQLADPIEGPILRRKALTAAGIGAAGVGGYALGRSGKPKQDAAE